MSRNDLECVLQVFLLTPRTVTTLVCGQDVVPFRAYRKNEGRGGGEMVLCGLSTNIVK